MEDEGAWRGEGEPTWRRISASDNPSAPGVCQPCHAPVSTSMSRKYRSHKRRRSQAVPSLEEQEAHDGTNDERNIEPSDVMEVDGPDSSRPAGEELEEEHPEEPPEEPDEELKRKQEIWEAFQEEHHEGAHRFHILSALCINRHPLSPRATSTVIAPLVFPHVGVRSASEQYVYIISFACHCSTIP